jgi:hypothetical protein
MAVIVTQKIVQQYSLVMDPVPTPVDLESWGQLQGFYSPMYWDVVEEILRF